MRRLEPFQEMSELLLLGAEIVLGGIQRRCHARNALGHLNPSALQGLDLLGVVGEEAHAP